MRSGEAWVVFAEGDLAARVTLSSCRRVVALGVVRLSRSANLTEGVAGAGAAFEGEAGPRCSLCIAILEGEGSESVGSARLGVRSVCTGLAGDATRGAKAPLEMNGDGRTA